MHTSRWKRRMAGICAALLLFSILPVQAAETGAAAGIDFDAINHTETRLLYGDQFYFDWATGTGLTNHDSTVPGRDCSGQAVNGANPDMVFMMTVTFSSVDGISDPAACWDQIMVRFRSSRVDGNEQPTDFYTIHRSTYGDAAVVDVQIPLSQFGTGSINWADVKDIIIRMPVIEAYHLGDTGDSPAIRATVANARIVDVAHLAARQQLQRLFDQSADYRYTPDKAAAAYQQVRQEALQLLNGYADEAAYAAMCDRLSQVISQLSHLRDTAEQAAVLTGTIEPVTPQDDIIHLPLTADADLSLHDPTALYLLWEGDTSAAVTGGHAVVHTNDGNKSVSFDALQTREANGHARFWLPLPALDTVSGVTITMQTTSDFRLTNAYIGDSTQQKEQADQLETLVTETPRLSTPSPVFEDDYHAAVAAAQQALAQGTFAVKSDLSAARMALLMARHAWREISCGDVDDDMQITAADALMALQAATQKITLEDTTMADVDKKEGVTAGDALQILQFATKKITAFPTDEQAAVDAAGIVHAEQAQGTYQATKNTLAPDASSMGLTDNGYLAYRQLDFGQGHLTTFMAVVSAQDSAVGNTMELHLDSPNGACIGSLTLKDHGHTIFSEQYAALTQKVTGVHDLYLVAPAGMHLDWFTLSAYNGVETAEERTARMSWWNDARFGMFVHWGAYANFPFDQIGPVDHYTEWVQDTLKISKEDYEQMAVTTFNPQHFDAEQVVQLAKDAGQKYIVFTSKHHEGYSMFNTQVTGFKDFSLLGYGVYQGGDPLMELAEASRQAGIPLGCYYSTMDWRHDATVNWGSMLDKPRYVADMKAQLRELIEQYDLDILWFDGEWVDWWTTQDGQDLYRYLRTIKPSIILNNRIGKRAAADGDFGTPEQEIPANGLGYDWESCITMNNNWGYAPYDSNWKSPAWVVQSVVDTASKGGNILLNIGPDSQGRVPEDCAANMREAGKWFQTYGDSIYGTTASPFAQALPFGAATKKEGVLYLHVTKWPQNGQITLPALKNTIREIRVMQTETSLVYTANGDTLTITLPDTAAHPLDTVIEVLVDGVPTQQNTFTYSENYALNKPTAVSNHYQNMGEYNGSAAVDGNTATRWATDDDITACWLEVDLGQATSFDAIQCREFTSTGGGRVTAYTIEYWDGSDWQVAHAGAAMGDQHTAHFESVTAQKVRLHILAIADDAQGGPSIWEFGVYHAAPAV